MGAPSNGEMGWESACDRSRRSGTTISILLAKWRQALQGLVPAMRVYAQAATATGFANKINVVAHPATTTRYVKPRAWAILCDRCDGLIDTYLADLRQVTELVRSGALGEAASLRYTRDGYDGGQPR